MSITVQTKKDGVWLIAESPSSGKSGMLNLNKIVNEMPKSLARTAFIEAIKGEASQLNASKGEG